MILTAILRRRRHKKSACDSATVVSAKAIIFIIISQIHLPVKGRKDLIMQEALKIFSNPKNPVEKDIAAFIRPLITEETAATIVEKKLTLAGCFKFTHDKAKSLKQGNVACPSYNQVMGWSCEYFGIKGATIPDYPTGAPALSSEQAAEEPKPKPALSLDFEDLFD